MVETKRGTPISLSVIYIILCKQLDIPIYGINLPRHFVVCYLDRYKTLDPHEDPNNKILFYINPFNKGSVLSKRDIDYFLKQLNVEQKPHYYLPCDHVSIIKRVLNNLIYSYEKLGHQEKVEELNILLDILLDGKPEDTDYNAGEA